MAEHVNASDSRHKFTLDTTKPPNLKEIHGSDSTMLLPRQWFPPKLGDSKPGLGSAGPHGNLGVDSKELFRPSLHDPESGRGDHWRDEERDTNSAIRRDHWREGDKEFGDTRKPEKWSDSSYKQSGESRRFPERWIDMNGRGNNGDQRRESKWNSRWGPEDKESDIRREKWSDYGKVASGNCEKDVPLLTSQGKESISRIKETDSEGESLSRSWRSSSYIGRGKGEVPSNQSLTPNKQGSMFGYGRGRGENVGQVYPVGRGKGNQSFSLVNNSALRSNPLGTSGKFEGAHVDHYMLRYNRMKLLDIYRMTDIAHHRKILEEFVEVPSLTLVQYLDPLALSAPTIEELGILEGIAKGNIVSSGLTQVSKDGSTGWHSTEMKGIEKRPEPGEDVSIHESWLSAGSALRTDPVNVSLDGKNNAAEAGLKLSDMGWSPLQNNLEMEPSKDRSHSTPFFHNAPNLSENEILHPKFERTPMGSKFPKVLNQENKEFSMKDISIQMENPTARKFQMPSSPEELSLYYKDPHGQVQGPFPGSDLIGWFEAGYFGIELPVRLAGAPADAPFALLGDVMPHLRLKARPPPGFTMAKQNDVLETSNKLKSAVPVDVHGIKSDFDVINSENKSRHEAATIVENRFLESLMSGNMRGSSSYHLFYEGTQGYGGSTSDGKSSVGGEIGSDVNYLLAQRMSSDPQRSLPNLSSWPGRDPSFMGSTPVIPDSTIPLTKSFPSVGEPHLIHQPLQQVDVLSILQAAAEKSQKSAVLGSGAVAPETVGMPHNQHLFPQSAFGIQQHRSPHIDSTLPSQLVTPHNEFSSRLATTATLLSPEISQDPRLLGLLEQQLLLSQNQLRSQGSLSAQPSLVDQLLYLKQQQQKQEQQLILQRQHHMLSQVLLWQQSHQNFGELSYAYPNSLIPSVNPSVDYTGIQGIKDLPQLNHHVPDPPVHLPHQILGDSVLSNNWDAAANSEVENAPNLNSMPSKAMEDGSFLEEAEKSEQIVLVLQKDNIDNDCSAIQNNVPDVCPANSNVPLVVPGGLGGIENPVECSGASALLSSFDQAHELNPSSESVHEQCRAEVSLGQGMKNQEIREIKKSLDKKSRKHKNSKTQSAGELEKLASKSFSSEHGKLHSLPDDENLVGSTLDMAAGSKSLPAVIPPVCTAGEPSAFSAAEISRGYQQEAKEETHLASYLPENTSHKAWKPAPSLKSKPLLEIQMEEQRMAQVQPVVFEASVTSAPLNLHTTLWSGVATSNTQVSESAHSVNPMSRKSQLHDLLAEVLPKAGEDVKDACTSDRDTLGLPSLSQMDAHVDTAFDDDFIDPKVARKNRKKAAKAKITALKSSPPVSSCDSSLYIPVEKVKPTRQGQQEAELSSIPSVGPSLGDYVLWRGDQVPTQAAWSTDLGRLSKPASLREILREQEKRASAPQPITISTPKGQPNQGNRVSETNCQISGTSSSKATHPKAASSIQTGSVSFQPKVKNEDDLFWGPPDHRKQDAKQTDFPSPPNANPLVGKIPAAKVMPGVSSTNQKPPIVRAKENSLFSGGTGHSISKTGKAASAKLSEAMDFKNWCENEFLRLTGSSDTSFLEYCMKQPTAEAEMLLKENLGSLDHNHEFIDKFINFKSFLPANILDVAFQARGALKVLAEASAAADGEVDAEDGSSKGGGGKKKGKKGKKVSPSVLGFNVVSNRIMMGEIQTIED